MAKIFKKIEQKLTQAADEIVEQLEKTPSLPDLPNELLDIDLDFDIDTNTSPPGRFRYPLGLTVNQEGNIVVTDFENHRIQILKWDGKFQKQIKCKLKSQVGSPNNWQSVRPMDVAVSDDGKYYITDEANEQIVVTTDKKVSSTFGRDARLQPRGIAVSKEGYIVVTDWWDERYCIRKYTTSGEQVGVYGLPTADKQPVFDMPLFLAVNSRNQILVSNQGRHCIHVLDWNGKFLFAFADRQSGDHGYINGPTGIDIDSEDNVYVCDPNKKRVVKFNCEGRYVSEIDLSHELERPYAIVISKDKRKLAFTEFQGHRVRIVDI